MNQTGSISHGTLRYEDLIPAFIAEARRRSALKTDVAVELDCIERRIENMPDYYESDAMVWDWKGLYDLLRELAPEGAYFGAHPGDGSDFGFWPVEIGLFD